MSALDAISITGLTRSFGAVDALRAGGIAGAGLDVYEAEPVIHPGLLELDNAVLLPHLGSATVETRTAMSSLLCQGIARAIRTSD